MLVQGPGQQQHCFAVSVEAGIDEAFDSELKDALTLPTSEHH